MASQFSISQIITFSRISQYLAGNDKSSQMGLKSGSFIGNLEGLLYIEGYLLENMNTLNPSSSTLRSTAEYVLSLCGKYLQQAIKIVNGIDIGIPAITGPSNQSVNVGQNAIFSVSVTGISPFTYSWFDYLGNPILGATSSSYTFLNSQLSDSGKTFYVKVTDANGQSAFSNTASLSVTASLIGYAYYGDTDYSTDLLNGIDNISYNFTFLITNNQPLAVQFPTSLNAKYIVIKYPNSQSAKTHYDNPPIDSGPIPGFALNATNISPWRYVFSRSGNPFTTNPPNLLTLS